MQFSFKIYYLATKPIPLASTVTIFECFLHSCNLWQIFTVVFSAENCWKFHTHVLLTTSSLPCQIDYYHFIGYNTLLLCPHLDIKDLIQKSFEAKENSYSPYSKFRVGAALLCEDGTVIKGKISKFDIIKPSSGMMWPNILPLAIYAST